MYILCTPWTATGTAAGTQKMVNGDCMILHLASWSVPIVHTIVASAKNDACLSSPPEHFRQCSFGHTTSIITMKQASTMVGTTGVVPATVMFVWYCHANSTKQLRNPAIHAAPWRGRNPAATLMMAKQATIQAAEYLSRVAQPD